VLVPGVGCSGGGLDVLDRREACRSRLVGASPVGGYVHESRDIRGMEVCFKITPKASSPVNTGRRAFIT
jgi:hypothetical protein